MTIVAHSTTVCSTCPRCGKTSRALHGWHQRIPQDLPSAEQGIDLVRQYLSSAYPTFRISKDDPDILKIPKSLFDTLVSTLCYAA